MFAHTCLIRVVASRSVCKLQPDCEIFSSKIFLWSVGSTCHSNGRLLCWTWIWHEMEAPYTAAWFVWCKINSHKGTRTEDSGLLGYDAVSLAVGLLNLQTLDVKVQKKIFFFISVTCVWLSGWHRDTSVSTVTKNTWYWLQYTDLRHVSEDTTLHRPIAQEAGWAQWPVSIDSQNFAPNWIWSPDFPACS